MTIGPTLASHFAGAAGKLLSAVEAHPTRSNQHEFNGVGGLAELLGDPPEGGRTYSTAFVYVDDDMQPVVADSTVTWYDARARHPTRSEYRLYYRPNAVMEAAAEGDYMVMAKPANHPDQAQLVVVVCPGRATVAAQIQHLFGLEPSARFDVETLKGDEELTFTSRLLLETLGFEAIRIQEDWLDRLIAEFGEEFPPTDRFSRFARQTLPDVSAVEDPDAALLHWMDQEESLYRTLERHIVAKRLDLVAGDVDLTLEIAMQTFQRRRSRAGHALENHVTEVLRANDVPFDRQATTEGRKRPDFLLPGQEAYRDPSFPADRLFMLGVKTTCKDRWRQVLTEADRVERKHLLTLEAPISRHQTDEMTERLLVPVVPRALHELFEPSQVDGLLSVANFLNEMRP